jgi:ribosomal protein S2
MNTTIKKRNSKPKTGIFQSQQPFKIGEILTIKIHTLTENSSGQQIGFSELSNGYTVVVPQVALGQEVSVQIEKIFSEKTKYAIAKVLKMKNKGQSQDQFIDAPVRAGEIIDVNISKDGPKGAGFVELPNQYVIVVPKTKVGDQVKIQITRVKKDYAFGKIFDENISGEKRNKKKNLNFSQLSLKSTSANVSTNANVSTKISGNSAGKLIEDLSSALMQNSKFHLVLPKKLQSYRGYIVVKLNGFVVFIKQSLGAKPGNIVRIQTMKVGPNFAVAKILKVSPLNKITKLTRTKTRIQEMILTGMHFGEKSIRCHANMRRYIWYRKKGKNQNRPLLKKDRYYINLLKTRRCLQNALKQLGKYAAKGKTFLFVGTKKSASALIARTALFTKTSFFVNTRWLGGMLTNWKTILKSISQIKPILKEKQKIIQNILQKRQKIKQRFIKKVNLLRKRSQKLMTKGKILMTKMKQNRNLFMQKSQQLIFKKQTILSKNQLFIQKYIELKLKKQELTKRVQRLYISKNLLLSQKQTLVQQFKIHQTKLKEFKQLFLIGQEFIKMKKNAKDQGQIIYTVSYGKSNEFKNILNSPHWLVPNPPKEILDRIIESMNMNYESISNNTSNKNRAKSEEKQKNIILFSKLLNKFTTFLPFIQIYIENLALRIQTLYTLLKQNLETSSAIEIDIKSLKNFSDKISTQMLKVKTKLLSQQKILKSLRSKLRRLASEQRLLKFLPRLRYLPSPKMKMAETVQILMKKFVDPKMTVPMDQIYDEKFQFTSKKIAAARKQKWQRLEKYFGGITKMAKMNENQIKNNIAIIIGQQEEMNAVHECEKLGIKMFTVVDTNCNPRLSNHIIPANDDSRNSIKYILEKVLTHIRLAQKLRQKIYSGKMQKYSTT